MQRFWYASVGSTITLRVVLVGHSCGATMSALVTLEPERFGLDDVALKCIRSCVGVQGLYDLRLYISAFPDWTSEIEKSQGHDHSSWDSPVNVSGTSVPWVVVHGLGDKYVPLNQAEVFVAHLKSLGQTVTLETNVPGDHFDAVQQGSTELVQLLLEAAAKAN
mmetsp:Transcript_47290/g.111336  ORF Transcript_47290/g.111336 Transcript_47290/m.111336 type:complete len:163 (-) Transcript_47290:65-553(-)